MCRIQVRFDYAHVREVTVGRIPVAGDFISIDGSTYRITKVCLNPSSVDRNSVTYNGEAEVEVSLSYP